MTTPRTGTTCPTTTWSLWRAAPSSSKNSETRAMAYRFTDLLPADFSDETLRQDVLKGLTAQPKWLPPKWFYDKTGSALFEDITRLPEYYPTRSERASLQARAAGM